MQTLIDTISAAVAEGATVDQKTAAAQACRTLLAAFEAQAGKPIAAAPQPSPLAMLGKLEPHQALDLLIARLRAAVPSTLATERAKGFSVPLIEFPRGGKAR